MDRMPADVYCKVGWGKYGGGQRDDDYSKKGRSIGILNELWLIMNDEPSEYSLSTGFKSDGW